jgi:hypothetical protein
MKPLLWLQLKLLLLCACALACQTADEQVGSACRNGVCPQSTAVQDGLACLVTETYWEVAVQPDDELPRLCLPSRIPSSGSGQLPCRMRVRGFADTGNLAALGVERCADQPFFEDVPNDSADPGFREVPGDFDGCLVRQLTVGQREDGEEGWFYSEEDDCPRVDVTPAVKAITLAGNGVMTMLECAAASVPDPEGGRVDVDPDLCGEPASVSTGDVGAACTPSVIPEASFDPREAYFEARSEQCQTSGCLVFQLDGDPSPDCTPPARCPAPEEIERSVFCSCRCDVPEGDPGPVCDCPNNFSCVELFGPPLPRGLRGGYCVRNHSH